MTTEPKTKTKQDFIDYVLRQDVYPKGDAVYQRAEAALQSLSRKAVRDIHDCVVFRIHESGNVQLDVHRILTKTKQEETLSKLVQRILTKFADLPGDEKTAFRRTYEKSFLIATLAAEGLVIATDDSLPRLQDLEYALDKELARNTKTEGK